MLIPTFSGVITKAQASAAIQEAAALYKEAYALDLADGTLDGNEGATPITTVAGKDVTYTASQSGDTITISFSYTDSSKGYTATYNGTGWTVTPAS